MVYSKHMFTLITPAYATDVVGTLDVSGVSNVQSLADIGPKFFTPIVYLIIVLAGIWAFLQFLLGGLGYITASGDAKKVQDAQNKLIHAITGLAIIAASFIITAIIGQLFFGRWDFILAPSVRTF